MRFHEHVTFYDYAMHKYRAAGVARPLDQEIRHSIKTSIARTFPESGERAQVSLLYAVEESWQRSIRPYYKVWPCIVPCLLRVPLAVPWSDAVTCTDVILARFAEGHEPLLKSGRLQSLLIWRGRGQDVVALANVSLGTATISEALLRCIQASDTMRFYVISPTIIDHITSTPVLNSYAFALKEMNTITMEVYKTIEDSLADVLIDSPGMTDDPAAPVEMRFPGRPDFQRLYRLAIALSLLAHDPSIIEPDVLAKDEIKYRDTRNPIIVERAKRRGKFGFHVGRQIEAMPHYRRPHFGLRHTGVGRTIPRIVPIRGAVVHRSKLVQVPTGYILPNGQEIEPATT